MRVREIMSAPAITLPSTTTVSAAAALLAARGFTAAPVIDDDGHLVGIVTEADLIRDRIAPDPRIHGLTFRTERHPTSTTPRGRVDTVAEVMTSPVESLTPGADVADAARMMIDENIRCFPVVDGDTVVGVVTRRDLLRSAVVHSDSDIQRSVDAELTALDDSGRFTVTVQAGVAEIEDFQDNADDRVAAAKAASAVPGVVAVQVRHQTCDPF